MHWIARLRDSETASHISGLFWTKANEKNPWEGILKSRSHSLLLCFGTHDTTTFHIGTASYFLSLSVIVEYVKGFLCTWGHKITSLITETWNLAYLCSKPVPSFLEGVHLSMNVLTDNINEFKPPLPQHCQLKGGESCIHYLQNKVCVPWHKSIVCFVHFC